MTAGGNIYKGNVFTGANSIPGGAADVKNNVESVFIPAGVTGRISVKVTATNIAGDGVPNAGTALDQDYALIVTNVNQTTTAAASSTGPSITAETCGTGLVTDPGEPYKYENCKTSSSVGPACSFREWKILIIKNRFFAEAVYNCQICIITSRKRSGS